MLLRELPLAVVSGACSLRCTMQASHFGGFSCCGAWAPKHRLSSCVTQLSVSLSYTTGLFAPQHVESSWTRYQTHVPCFGRQILNHWTTREVLIFFLLWIVIWVNPLPGLEDFLLASFFPTSFILTVYTEVSCPFPVSFYMISEV